MNENTIRSVKTMADVYRLPLPTRADEALSVEFPSATRLLIADGEGGYIGLDDANIDTSLPSRSAAIAWLLRAFDLKPTAAPAPRPKHAPQLGFTGLPGFTPPTKPATPAPSPSAPRDRAPGRTPIGRTRYSKGYVTGEPRTDYTHKVLDADVRRDNRCAVECPGSHIGYVESARWVHSRTFKYTALLIGLRTNGAPVWLLVSKGGKGTHRLREFARSLGLADLAALGQVDKLPNRVAYTTRHDGSISTMRAAT